MQSASTLTSHDSAQAGLEIDARHLGAGTDTPDLGGAPDGRRNQVVGPVEIQYGRRAVLRDGRAAPLSSRAFDVLMTLVDHRDRVVCRQELLAAAWKRRRVHDNNLAVQVAALRRLLGSGAIETVRGQGYRLVAPVHPALAGVPPSPDLADAVPELFGRQREFQAMHDMLAQHALVTITGVCGVGKTALARQLWRGTPADHALVWASLDDIDDPARAMGHVARMIGVPGLANDIDALVAVLRDRPALLVLDGCERCVEPVSRLASGLLRAGARTTLLVTSQVPLNLYAEQVLRLDTLETPAPGATLAEMTASPSVSLFLQRARTACPAFRPDAAELAHIGRVCRDLGGLPLAIVLAAGRAAELGIGKLSAALGAGAECALRVLSGPERPAAPPHHRSLPAAMAYAHGALDVACRAVLQRMSARRAPFTLVDARRQACDGTLDEWSLVDSIGELVTRSLLECSGGPEPTYRVSQWARAMIASDGEGAV